MKAELSYCCLDNFRVGTLLLEAVTRELMPSCGNRPIKVSLRSGLQANRKAVGAEQSSSSPSCQHCGELNLNWASFLPLRDIWQCVETLLIVMTKEMLCHLYGERLGAVARCPMMCGIFPHNSNDL